jgi:homoserine kinase type II
VAQLTALTLEEARALGAKFGLEVVAMHPLLAGSVNTNARLTTVPGGSYFLRIYEEQTLATAPHEAGLLEALAAAGVPTPCPLPRSDGAGGAIAEHAGKPVAVFPFVAGDVVCQRRVTARHTRAVGGALARLHAAGEGVMASAAGAFVGESRFGAGALAARLDGLAARTLPEDVARSVVALRSAVESSSAGRARVGRLGLIHGDLFRDNVLFEGERLSALLDFESASRGPFAFDLAVALLAWCFGDDLELPLARALVDGYVASRPLEAETRVALFDQASFACARFATTRITDFELRPRGTGVYKDFRRWLAREASLRRLGEGGLDRALFG